MIKSSLNCFFWNFYNLKPRFHMDSLSMDDVGFCRHTVQGRQNEKTDFVVYVSRLEYFCVSRLYL